MLVCAKHGSYYTFCCDWVECVYLYAYILMYSYPQPIYICITYIYTSLEMMAYFGRHDELFDVSWRVVLHHEESFGVMRCL